MNSDAELIYQFLSAPGPVPERADIIIALGTYDLRVADYAAEVFLSGRAPLLICSGGLGKLTSSLFTTPEAELFAERCRSLGVPPENILIEAASTNTGENFRFSRDLLSERGIFPRMGIAVCKPYMAKRAWATGTRQWPEVTWSVMTQPLSRSWWAIFSGCGSMPKRAFRPPWKYRMKSGPPMRDWSRPGMISM